MPAQRVISKIQSSLAAKDHPGTALSGQFAGLCRLRVGDYRVIYARTGKGFLILRIGRRREVYRK
jgi:mRNA interferase RelE/StbE